MMQELKKSWKLLKYTYQFKTNIAVAVFFMVLGIFWMPLNNPTGWHVAVIYFYIGPCMLVQLNYNLLYAGQVASSTQRKVLDTSFPNVIGLCSSLISYIITAVYIIVSGNLNPMDEISRGNVLVMAGVVMAVAIIYYGAAFKYFVVSTILFGICFGLVYACGMAFLKLSGVEISMISGGFIGLAIVVAANGLAVLMRRALYKLPSSPLAGGRSLRKAMQ